MEASSLMIVFRGTERILVVAAAAFCIWLGYRLFQSLPTVHGSNGRLELPSAKLTFSKVGPGVFFGLFGALVLAQSAWTVTTDETTTGGSNPTPGVTSRRTMGVSQSDGVTLAQAQIDIGILNCLAEKAPANLSRIATNAVVHKAKVAVLEGAWQPSWPETVLAELQEGTVPPAGPVAALMASLDPSCVGATQ